MSSSRSVRNTPLTVSYTHLPLLSSFSFIVVCLSLLFIFTSCNELQTRYEDAGYARTVIGENTLADADILESRGHAPAEHLAVLGRLSFVLLECFSQTFFALIDGIHHTHAVFEYLTADRDRTRIDRVAAAQLERVDAQLFRHHVHRSFNGDRRLIDTVAAERAALQVIIANRRAFHLDIGNDVRYTDYNLVYADGKTGWYDYGDKTYYIGCLLYTSTALESIEIIHIARRAAPYFTAPKNSSLRIKARFGFPKRPRL